jgi:hypothetical protein
MIHPVRLIFNLCLSILLLILTTALQAQVVLPKRLALLIGNWDYNLNGSFDPTPSKNFVSDLRNPCRELIKFKFEIHDFCNLDKESFDRKVDAFAALQNKLPKKSIVFVYYAGHGLQHNGHEFAVPVMFQLNPEILKNANAEEQFKIFNKNANTISGMIQKLTDDPNIALVVALDKCRDGPLNASTAYNDAVSIRTGPNTLIQYATTAGDKTPDGVGRNSEYALVLSSALSKGGDIGVVMARVNNELWIRYRGGNRDTYADTHAGPAFISLKYLPLDENVKQATPAPTTSPKPDRAYKMVRNIYDGVSLDMIWCEGEEADENFKLAASLAKKIASRAKELGVGRVQLKPLTVAKNLHDGYNVHRNLLRYDASLPSERELLVKIASEFPEANFLPQRGVGVAGKPTKNYVSAFICGHQ